MPCGGISRRVLGKSVAEFFSTTSAPVRCMNCNERIESAGDSLFVEEWDGFIHYLCLGDYLNSEEGGIVLLHGHEIMVEAQEV